MWVARWWMVPGRAGARVAMIAILLCPMAARAADWVSLGPAPQENGYNVPPQFRAENVSGHAQALAWSPDVYGHGTPAVFLGAVTGGVWRSTDYTAAAPTWTPLTDSLGLSPEQAAGAMQVGSLAVDPNHPNVVYAGTGWPFYGYGAGLLKSTDGGDHWTLLGPETLGRQSITSVIVDPTDPAGDTLYCGTVFGSGYADWGIYKSTDGGLSWNRVSAGIGTPSPVTGMAYTVNAVTGLTLYAGVIGAYAGDTYGGLWQSTDDGDHWTRIAKGPPTGEAIGNIALAADPVPGLAPAVYAAFTNGAGDLVNIYKTPDGGATWTATNPPDIARGWGTWALALGLAPDGTVYAGSFGAPFNDGLVQSTDGGETWSVIDVGTNGEVPHTNHHAFAFADGLLFDANDGGVWRFLPQSGGQPGPGEWDNLNTFGLSTHQVNGVSPHPLLPDVFLETGEAVGTARSEEGYENVWDTVAGGNGGHVRFDPSDGDVAYRTGPEADRFQRSDDGGRTWQSAAADLAKDASFPYYPVFAVSPTQARHVVIGSTRIHATDDGGETWSPISDVMTEGATPVSALAFAPDNPAVIYAAFSGPFNDGTTASQVFRTADGGERWEDATSDQPWGVGRRISALVVGPGDGRTAWLSVADFGTGTIWRTDDGGEGWDSVAGDIPDLPVNTLAVDFAVSPPALYAGTDVGVWASTDGGEHWERFGTGLPDVRVMDLQLQRDPHRLVAGTFGRGVWLIPLPPAILAGDVNDDTHVDMADAALALQIAGGLRPSSAAEVARGDVAPDGRVTFTDALVIARSALS